MKFNQSKNLEKILLTGICLLIIFLFYKTIHKLSFVYDVMHHGLIFTNALDVLMGKTPYREVFIQYGLLGTLINSFALYISNLNSMSIIFILAIFYFSSIIMVGLSTASLTNSTYMILALIIFLFNHPIPWYPWPNYISFFFLIFAVYIFTENNLSKLFLSGIFFSLACLVRENFFYFIGPSVIIINILIYIFNKKFDRNIAFILGFLLPLLIFLIYLISNDLFNEWLLYQKLPFVYLEKTNLNLLTYIKEFISFFIFKVTFNIINEPQYVPILFVLVINSLTLMQQVLVKKERNLKLITISLICLSSSITSISYELFRLYTSVIIGLPIVFYQINKFKKEENKFIFCFILMFVSFYSFLYFPNGNAKFYKNVDVNNSYVSKKIKYFRSQKWTKNSWDNLNYVINIESKIKKKCNIEYIVNLTPNSYFLSVSSMKRIQLKPNIVNNLGEQFKTLLEDNFYKKIIKEVVKNNVYIYSMENNEKQIIDYLDSYYLASKLKVNYLKGTDVLVFLPKSCKIKI